MIYIIGAGGVGSWLTPAIQKLAREHQITVMDGDRLEKKNLDRQLFSESEIGQNKASATAKRLGVGFIPKYFTHGCMELNATDLLMVCVDNHPARVASLLSCDMFGCKAIFGANETYSAEAYYYQREWKDGPRDPRIMYPEILTSIAGDPTRVQAGCTGEAQIENPQLSSANFMAAALMQHLFVLWMCEYPKMDIEFKVLPNKVWSTMSRVGCDGIICD